MFSANQKVPVYRNKETKTQYGEEAEFPQKTCVKEFHLKKYLMRSKMSQSKIHCELCKPGCQLLLSERKLEYEGKVQKELKNLLIESGLQEAVEAKLPVGSQPQPDIDTGKLVAQVWSSLCSRTS